MVINVVNTVYIMQPLIVYFLCRLKINYALELLNMIISSTWCSHEQFIVNLTTMDVQSKNSVIKTKDWEENNGEQSRRPTKRRLEE
jgi:hypothetical protein